ncbi:MAG TPA: hypothetical protein VGG72_07250 [Bryobacteraceae bacterium]|jgi:hypothetical protein
MSSAAPPRIRESTFEDAGAISQLNQRNGMGALDQIAWRECWETHPFAAEFRNIPIGWVLENEPGCVVGSLDNIHMLYDLAGKPIKAVVAAGWLVDPEHRGKALQLMTTFFRQPGIDLWLNVTATPATGQILTAMKLKRIPIPDYGSPCFWALRPRAFARAALQRRSIRGAALAAWPAGLALLARDVWLRSGRGKLTAPVRRLKQFDERFDELWASTRTAPKRLRAVRTRALLEWRFRNELRGGRAVIITAEEGAALSGYAVLARRKDTDTGMNLYDLADLQARGDDPATFRNLLLGSIKIAREEGADALKFSTGTPAKRAPAEALRPYSYRLPFWQQYFKASPELTAELSIADAWDFSWFDGF